MLFDITWPQLVLIGAVALVIIGPKDLPSALRVAGFWFRKARSLSHEFRSGVEQMIREAELDEIRQQLKTAAEFDVEKEFQKTVDPTGELARGIARPDAPNCFDQSKSPTPAPAPVTMSKSPGMPLPAATSGSASAGASDVIGENSAQNGAKY